MATKNLNRLLFFSSLVFLIEGLTFVFCIPFALYYRESSTPFLLPGLILVCFGLLFYIFTNQKAIQISDRYHELVIFVYSWILLILLGTIPYFISNTIPNFINVIFETISGFTTTGTTTISDIEELPKSIILYRSMTQWIGGFAAIITAVIVLPRLNLGGYKLFTSEMLKQNHSIKYINKIIKSLIIAYVLLTIIQSIILYLQGINLLESICYSFGTISTGNFYPSNNGLNNSTPFVQYIFIFFMFFSGINYLFYFSILNKKHRGIIIPEEVKLYGIGVLSVIIFLSVARYFNSNHQIETLLRETTFQVLSFFTTSGYTTTNYLLWPHYLVLILVLILFIGGCTNTSTGGIKFSRFIIMLKNLKSTFKMISSDLGNYEIKYNRKRVDVNINLSILTYITVFGFVFMLGSLLLSLLNIDFEAAAFLSISALSTFGNAQNIANFPYAGKIILASLMLIGKLEIYTLILIFFPAINKKMN